MTSYGNPFYDYMRKQRRKNGVKCITTVDSELKKAHYLQYLSYKHMMIKWRYNIKHVKVIKNRFATQEG